MNDTALGSLPARSLIASTDALPSRSACKQTRALRLAVRASKRRHAGRWVAARASRKPPRARPPACRHPRAGSCRRIATVAVSAAVASSSGTATTGRARGVCRLTPPPLGRGCGGGSNLRLQAADARRPPERRPRSGIHRIRAGGRRAVDRAAPWLHVEPPAPWSRRLSPLDVYSRACCSPRGPIRTHACRRTRRSSSDPHRSTHRAARQPLRCRMRHDGRLLLAHVTGADTPSVCSSRGRDVAQMQQPGDVNDAHGGAHCCPSEPGGYACLSSQCVVARRQSSWSLVDRPRACAVSVTFS